eukprot:3095348-Rhodomonas_salina.1
MHLVRTFSWHVGTLADTLLVLVGEEGGPESQRGCLQTQQAGQSRPLPPVVTSLLPLVTSPPACGHVPLTCGFPRLAWSRPVRGHVSARSWSRLARGAL